MSLWSEGGGTGANLEEKWCTLNREFCEDGEVIRWTDGGAIRHREGRCKGLKEESEDVITRSRI